jgi:hypothetical protein
MTENKRDYSITMAKANIIALGIVLPVAVLQFVTYTMIHGAEKTQPSWSFNILFIVVILGVAAHELIHGISWAAFGRRPFSVIKFGFQWKTITPYAHLREPVEVNAYRLGAFMPGFVLGILPYGISLLTGNGNLFWFGLVHTALAGGDWLVLWLLRSVKAGLLVEDHPTNAGCYVLEGQ